MLQLIIFSNISSFVCRHSTYKNHVLYLCVSLDFSFILHRHSLVGATGGGKCSSIFFSIKDIFWPLSWTGVNKKLIYFIKDHFGSVKVKKKRKTSVMQEAEKSHCWFCSLSLPSTPPQCHEPNNAYVCIAFF